MSTVYKLVQFWLVPGTTVSLYHMPIPLNCLLKICKVQAQRYPGTCTRNGLSGR